MLDPTVFDDPRALGSALAREIVHALRAASARGDRFVLGCPGGRSPMTTYAALVELVGSESVDLSALTVVMMDEYLEPSGAGLRAVSPAEHYSVARFAAEHIAGPLNRAAGPGRTLARDRLLFPDPADPAAYDLRLAELGGVDLFILASGESDGHVAFNPPGSALDSTTRVVRLAESTRRDNLGTFPAFERLDQVPAHGISVGVGTIRTTSRRAVLVATGAGKGSAVQRICAADDYDPGWPSTVLVRCSDASLYTDPAAMRARPHVGADAHWGQSRE
jgi:glucosamine-6-phosphate deaminase